MTPYQQARQVYETEPCARTFEEDLVAHFANGYVINTPEVFGMFRVVDSSSDVILDPTREHFPHGGDCWHIYCAAGDLSKFFSYLPYPLPLVSFERKNKLRFYDYPKLLERITGYSHGRI